MARRRQIGYFLQAQAVLIHSHFQWIGRSRGKRLSFRNRGSSNLSVWGCLDFDFRSYKTPGAKRHLAERNERSFQVKCREVQFFMQTGKRQLLFLDHCEKDTIIVFISFPYYFHQNKAQQPGAEDIGNTTLEIH